jgi:glycosyltransferase involved in cell wall biosynthesis
MIENRNDLVSIITPSYGSARFIAQTIESVLDQTYPHWEMIIVDDVSPDNANQIIESYTQKDDRIKLIKLDKNGGPARARNRAIEEAKGRYIAFLDSDDIWLPQKLEKQIKLMQEKNLSMTYSSYFTIDENGNHINTRITKEKITYTDMLKSNYIGNLTGIYDQEKHGKHFQETAGHEDYILWLKIIKLIKETEGDLEPLAKYRILSNSISAKKTKVLKWQWNIYRKVEKLNVFTSSYNFVWYVYFGLKKRM